MHHVSPSLTAPGVAAAAMSWRADFVGASYLDMAHAAWELRPWERLSGGAPAVFSDSPMSQAVAQQLADLVGCQRATLGVSTLHLCWDLFGLLAHEDLAIYLDSGAYPILQWGVERAVGIGAPMQEFEHFDATDLRQRIEESFRERLRPLVVSDAFCPTCGRCAPVAEYLEVVRESAGLLLLDDSQALGVLGAAADTRMPYGRGGGGILQWTGVAGTDVLVMSSLAKGFGVPLAMLGGGGDLIQWFEDHSETRVHCSPPAVVSLLAAERALELNTTMGDAWRSHLARLVEEFRALLQSAGFVSTGDAFPVQQLEPIPGVDVEQFHDKLSALGVRTALCQGHDAQPRITFIINRGHSQEVLEFGVMSLTQAMTSGRPTRIINGD